MKEIEDQICIAAASWFGRINTGGVTGARVDKAKIPRAWRRSPEPEVPTELWKNINVYT